MSQKPAFDPEAVVNPTDDKWQQPPERFTPREGEKVWAVVGLHRDTASFGPTMEIGAVCILDPAGPDEALNPPTDVGLGSVVKLVVNERGMRWIVAFASALKYTAPFSAMKDEGNMIEVISSNKGIFVGTCVHDSYLPAGKPDEPKNYVTISKVQDCRVADLAALGLTIEGELTPDVLALIQKGEADFADRLAKRAESKAKRPAGGRPAARPSGGVSKPVDDDIPF